MCKNSKGNVDINHFIPLCRYIGVHLSLTSKVGVEESIVNAPRITDQLLKSNLTFCVVCVFTLQTDEWCVHNLLFNANFENKFK
jgi:hypothetical protein